MKKKVYLGISIIGPVVIFAITGIMPKGFQSWIFAAIMLGFYICALVMLKPLVEIEEELEVVNSSLKKEFLELENLTEEIKQDRKYSILKEHIDNINLKYLHKVFNLYKKNLKPIEIENEQGEILRKYYSFEDSANYFEEETLINKNMKMKTINHITQALTGMGIFGTFLGIVNGLKDLNMGDSEAMKVGVESLITGVKFSFSTSLYGIFLSIVLIFIIKIFIDRIMQKTVELSDYINDAIPIYSEDIGFREIEIQLKKQTTIYEKLASNVAEEMGKRFNDSLNENVEKLTEKFGTFITEMNENLINSISANNSESFEKINNSMEIIAEKLTDTMEKINDKQDNNTEKFMGESIKSIKEAINIGTDNEIVKLKETMEIISSKNSDIVEGFTNSIENMSKLLMHQESLIQNANTSTETINLSNDSMKDLQIELKDILHNFKDFNMNNLTSTSNIQKTVAEIKESMVKQLEVGKNLDAMMDKAYKVNVTQEKYMKNLDNILKSTFTYTEKLESDMGKINKDITMYKNEFKDIKNSMVDLSKGIEEKTKGLLMDLGKSNEDVRNTMESIDENILNRVNEMSNTLNSVILNLENNNKNITTITTRIEKFTAAERASQEIWECYEDSFKELNNNITEGVENYTNLISKGTNELFTEYDNKIAEAVNELGKLVETLSSNAEDIVEALEPVEKLVATSKVEGLRRY